jgi:hypothetical protein
LAVLPASAQLKPIEQFYPFVDSLCLYPPVDKQLEIVCQKKIDRWYITFVGVKGEKKALLAAATFEPIADPKAISLTVDFDGAKATTGKVPTWGYVFDRNSDGRIDYLALVEGAAPFKDDDFPQNFPLRQQPLSNKDLEYYVGRSRLVFNHFADDNYDNYIDALVHIDLDPKRDWVERHVFARSTKFNNKFDEAWAFTRAITEPHQRLAFTPDAVPVHPLDNPNSELTAMTLGERTAIMRLFDRAAKACNLTGANFTHPERRD